LLRSPGEDVAKSRLSRAFAAAGSGRIYLALGSALPLIMEWRPADFGSVGTFEVCLLFSIRLALWRSAASRRLTRRQSRF
jgi:hypothetical protein